MAAEHAQPRGQLPLAGGPSILLQTISSPDELVALKEAKANAAAAGRRHVVFEDFAPPQDMGRAMLMSALGQPLTISISLGIGEQLAAVPQQ